jgi:hypothetical protein
MPVWAALLMSGVVLLLLFPAMFYARYGAGWAVAWEVAQCAWLPFFFVVPATLATWLRRHLSWAFSYFAFVMTMLFFGWVVLLFGVWLSPWSCLVIGLGAGVLTVAGIWPAQLRFYKLQQSLADAQQTGPSVGS